MTPEQIADRNSVWDRMALECPEFSQEYDVTGNYHAIREIVLSGSVTWAAANGYSGNWPGKKVMDIGANAAIYSIFCALKGAEVTAYEPFSSAFNLVNDMLKRTKLCESIKLFNKAVWTYNGLIPYIGHRTPNEDVTCYNGGVPTDGVKWLDNDYAKADHVECVSFETAIGNTDWDFVKMDIEGGEFELILCTRPEALRRIKFMYVEFHDWANINLYRETIDKLESIFRCKFYPEGSTGRYEAAYLWKK